MTQVEAALLGAAVALVTSIASLVVTIALERRRRRERRQDKAEKRAELRARQAVDSFEQNVASPFRESLGELERLSVRIIEAAGLDDRSKRRGGAIDLRF